MEDSRPPSPPKAPANPVLAATIMLLRDDRGALEVFMVQRHHQIDFATGALVFPGGKTDPADREPALRPHCPGCEDLDEESLALRVSAVRETFEECGVLVARARGERRLLPESRVRPLETAHRADLLAGRYTMRDLVEQHTNDDRPVTVVTADLEVARQARAMGADIALSDLFLASTLGPGAGSAGRKRSTNSRSPGP